VVFLAKKIDQKRLAVILMVYLRGWVSADLTRFALNPTESDCAMSDLPTILLECVFLAVSLCRNG
jgi:hypothetical protein